MAWEDALQTSEGALDKGVVQGLHVMPWVLLKVWLQN